MLETFLLFIYSISNINLLKVSILFLIIKLVFAKNLM